MDEQVLAAMARWPNVPDVFGWLSLNAGGQWRLHPDGDALSNDKVGNEVAQGVPMSSTRINQFINRNYAHDARGRWYFQNGPQRVFVRLDVAPFILHTIDPDLEHPVFLTHNGLRTKTVVRWCLDDAGHFYADTDQGAGLVASRDLEQVLNNLATAADGASLLDNDLFDQAGSERVNALDVRWGNSSVVPLHRCRVDQVPGLLGFVRYPLPEP